MKSKVEIARIISPPVVHSKGNIHISQNIHNRSGCELLKTISGSLFYSTTMYNPAYFCNHLGTIKYLMCNKGSIQAKQLGNKVPVGQSPSGREIK